MAEVDMRSYCLWLGRLVRLIGEPLDRRIEKAILHGGPITVSEIAVSDQARRLEVIYLEARGRGHDEIETVCNVADKPPVDPPKPPPAEPPQQLEPPPPGLLDDIARVLRRTT